MPARIYRKRIRVQEGPRLRKNDSGTWRRTSWCARISILCGIQRSQSRRCGRDLFQPFANWRKTAKSEDRMAVFFNPPIHVRKFTVTVLQINKYILASLFWKSKIFPFRSKHAKATSKTSRKIFCGFLSDSAACDRLSISVKPNWRAGRNGSSSASSLNTFPLQ